MAALDPAIHENTADCRQAADMMMEPSDADKVKIYSRVENRDLSALSP